MPRSVRTDIIQPTWHNGFAHYAGESAHPELWPRAEAWAPGLGPTGDVVRGLVNGANGDFSASMEPASDWQIQDGRYALNFDDEAPQEEIVVPATSLLEVTSVTMAMWAYARTLPGTGGTEAGLFEKSIGGAINKSYLILVDNSVLIGRAVVGGNVAARDAVDPTNFPLNVWKHVAYTYDEVSGDSFLYVDGLEVDSTTSVGGAIDTGSGTAHIGSLTQAEARFHWDGFMDDIFIDNRPLSSSEIFQLYSLKRGGIFQLRPVTVGKAVAAAGGRIMSSLTNAGGLAGVGGIAGQGGGLAG